MPWAYRDSLRTFNDSLCMLFEAGLTQLPLELYAKYFELLRSDTHTLKQLMPHCDKWGWLVNGSGVVSAWKHVRLWITEECYICCTNWISCGTPVGPSIYTANSLIMAVSILVHINYAIHNEPDFNIFVAKFIGLMYLAYSFSFNLLNSGPKNSVEWIP